MNFTVGIISQNLVTPLNFVEFRDNRNFIFLEAPRVTNDTWHVLDDPSGAMFQIENKSNKSLSGT